MLCGLQHILTTWLVYLLLIILVFHSIICPGTRLPRRYRRRYVTLVRRQQREVTVVWCVCDRELNPLLFFKITERRLVEDYYVWLLSLWWLRHTSLDSHSVKNIHRPFHKADPRRDLKTRNPTSSWKLVGVHFRKEEFAKRVFARTPWTPLTQQKHRIGSSLGGRVVVWWLAKFQMLTFQSRIWLL